MTGSVNESSIKRLTNNLDQIMLRTNGSFKLIMSALLTINIGVIGFIGHLIFEHTQLPAHPVGQTKQLAIESTLKEIRRNVREIKDAIDGVILDNATNHFTDSEADILERELKKYVDMKVN